MFASLRTHGHHSLLTGVDAPLELVRRARDLGHAAIALTDVDNLTGVVDFVHALERANAELPERPIHGLVGAEITNPSGDGRIVALVRNETGWRNLCKLVSARQLGADPGDPEDGLTDDTDPRASFDLAARAAQYHDGLVLLVDHPHLLVRLAGRVPARWLFAALSPAAIQKDGAARSSRARRQPKGPRNTHLEEARRQGGSAGDGATIRRARGPSGSGVPWDELQEPEDFGLARAKVPPPAHASPASELSEAARAVGVATLAVPDVYWARPAGADDHRVRVAIKHNALALDLDDAWLAEEPAHLFTFREVCALYAGLEDVAGPWPITSASAPAEDAPCAADYAAALRDDAVPAIVARTLAVASECRYRPPLGHARFPEVELAEGETAYSKLCELAFEGARARYRPLRPEVVRRLDYELSSIDKLGFAAYFLLVHRLAEFARLRAIPFVGRGSAAASLVSYALGLTDADPLRYRLPFERFLNPTRADRPDIDLDFCWRRRDEVLEHVYDAFGPERTAMIVTVATFGLRSAFREVALAEGVPPAEIHGWSRYLPWHVSGADATPFSGAADDDHDPAQLVRGPARTRRYEAPGHDPRPRTSEAPGSTERPTSGPPLGHGELVRESAPPALDPTRIRATGDRDGPVEGRGDERLSFRHQEREANGPGRTVGVGRDGPPPRRPTPRAPLPAHLADNRVAHAIALTPECREFPFDDERWQRVIARAARLVDRPRYFGLHPGGVVVSPGPITDFVPCQRAAKGVVVTQLDKDAVEAVGLVKMDLLGNRALTTIDDCLVGLRANGIEVDPSTVPEDDPLTAEVLREGRTLGCFQVESPGMRNLLQQTGARTMDDVIQAVALIRPGPAGSGMKDAYVRRFRGLEEPTPPHPRLAELLWDTHGVMLYQEDVMQAASLVAGLELSEADQLRRALQKRRTGELARLEERFLASAEANGIPPDEARPVWELASNFASFAFCKAHAVTYGRIAYRCVWLKTHHPAAFLAAFLASETGYYRARVYVEEARRLGVPILPPDINRSGATFALEWVRRRPAVARAAAPGHAAPGHTAPGHAVGTIRIGLGQVKGLGSATVERLLDERERGPYLSLADFLERTNARTDEVEALIQCGAFDAFDRTRPELLWRLHLLRKGRTHLPRSAAARRALGELGHGLDPSRLAACGESPESRGRKATESARARAEVESARARTGGWAGRGLGLGAAELAPGETAALFDEPETPALVLPGLPDVDSNARGRVELELLGLTTVAHPTRLFPCAGEERVRTAFGPDAFAPHPDRRRDDPLRPVNRTSCASLERFVGGRVTLCGWLAASRRVRTKNGETMRFLTLEDESGLAEVVLFPDVYRTDGHRLTEQGPFLVTGTVEDQLGARTLHAERIW